MKVLHICTQDSGGAGIAAYRLHLGLKSIGIQSKMLVLYKSSSDSDVIEFTQNNSFLRQIQNRIRNRLISSEFNAYNDSCQKGLEIFTDNRSIYDVSKHPFFQEVDIIHLHWIARMVDYMEFFQNILNKHIIWTLHDINPFTGGCHYAGDCIKYETVCHACPQLESTSLNDLSKRIWMRKEKCYRGQKIHIVSPSKWLADCAGRSQLFKHFKIDVIPNGLSTSVFTRRNEQYSKELLGLSNDKTFVMFGAQLATNKRKGVNCLIKALKLLIDRVDNLNIALAIFGSDSSADFKDIEFPVYSLGIIRDEPLLSACYSASDMFVLPSLEDNFPNTILESMSCGTPVIGFDVGGMSDIIKPGKTGFLAKTGDVEQLSRHIGWMIDHPKECEQMGLNARKLVEREYTVEIQAERYRKLYEAMYET